MSTCERNREELSDFVDGTLDAARSVMLSSHLEECPVCRREYHALKDTLEMLRTAPVPDGRQAQRNAIAMLRRANIPASTGRPRTLAGLRMATATLIAATILAFATSRDQQRPGTAVRPTGTMVAAVSTGLPTSLELDEMASLHAVHSFAVAAGDAGDQQETLADATSRITHPAQ